MLYRLRPPQDVTWCDIPSAMALEAAARHPEANLDNLSWEATEHRSFSDDLLRIALRQGQATRAGLVVDAVHTVDLGRADELTLSHRQTQDAQDRLRDSASGELMDRLIPGWREHGEALDREVAQSVHNAAREAEEDVAAVLAQPARPELVEHWSRLGGRLPDEG